MESPEIVLNQEVMDSPEISVNKDENGDELNPTTRLSSEDVEDEDVHDEGSGVHDEGSGSADNSVENEMMAGMSKRAWKRMKRHEQWLLQKGQRRKEERLKKKRKFTAARERGDDMGPSRKSLKKNCMANSSCEVKVALDCSFDKYMTEKDVCHLVQQIQHSYAANRRADNPLQFYVCGVNGKAEDRLNTIGDYKGWDVNFKTEDYLELFPKQDVVYLSSDSPNILQVLDDTKVYVIGGLVDHNHYKGLCHQLAEEKGVSHAQLPISEYIDLKTRKVLTINHVFEILLKFTETRDWEKAFFQVLPQRKGAATKDKKGEDKQQTSSEQDSVVQTVETESSCDNGVSHTDTGSSEVSESVKQTVMADSQEDITLVVERELHCPDSVPEHSSEGLKCKVDSSA